MRLTVEVDNRYFLQDGEQQKRIYITFDEAGRQRLIDLLSQTGWSRDGQIFKLMSEDWGPHDLSQKPYYENTTVGEILELTYLKKSSSK